MSDGTRDRRLTVQLAESLTDSSHSPATVVAGGQSRD